MDIRAIEGRSIPIGRLGENEHIRIIFDVSPWLAEYPNATFTLLNKLPRSLTAYPVASAVQDGEAVYWTVTAADLSREGKGACELIVYQGDVIAKSIIWTTEIRHALDGSGEAPEGWESWQEVFAALKGDAETAQRLAQAAAQTSTDMAQVATEKAGEAAGSATEAARSAEEALGSRTAAAISEANAATSERNAGESEEAAGQSATLASGSASAARLAQEASEKVLEKLTVEVDDEITVSLEGENRGVNANSGNVTSLEGGKYARQICSGYERMQLYLIRVYRDRSGNTHGGSCGVAFYDASGEFISGIDPRFLPDYPGDVSSRRMFETTIDIPEGAHSFANTYWAGHTGFYLTVHLLKKSVIDASVEAAESAARAEQSAEEAAQSAEEAAESKSAIESMGASATTLAEGSQASVTKQVDPQTGAVTLAFGIPKGDTGDPWYENSRVTSLDNTQLAIGTTIEAIGTPVYVKNIAAYSEYGITQTGWYVFARINAKDGVTVTNATTITGAAGQIITVGTAYVDVAVRFEVAAQAQAVTVDWGASAETFVFRAVDLAVRNLDYRTTFYVYDLAPFVSWEYALTTDATFAADKYYYTESGGEYTLAEVTANDPVPAYYTLADETYTQATGVFEVGVIYYTKSDDTYSEAAVTVGDPIPAYYNHSKLHIEGMARNVTYQLDTPVDCPSEIVLPAIEEDGTGAWYEMRFRHTGSFSSTLMPQDPDVKVATEHTQAESAGMNMVDLHYMSIAGTKIWRFMNTHATIPAAT